MAGPKPAFQVDTNVKITLSFDLAMRLADAIFESKTSDKQLLALAHTIKSEEENYE